MARNIIFGLSGLAMVAGAPAVAAPPSTSARATAFGTQYVADFVQDQNPFSSYAEASLPDGSIGGASGLAYAFLGKLGTKTNVSLTNYIPNPAYSNSSSAFAVAGFVDTLTGVSADPNGFAKISFQVSGSITGNGGATGNYGDSRFAVSFSATSQDGNHFAKFDLLSLIAADPLTGDPVLTNGVDTEYLLNGNLLESDSYNPADPFRTYDWIFPFDPSQPWTLVAGMSCLTFTGANEPDSSSLNCLLDNSTTLMGISLLDAGGDPVVGASVTSLSGQNYNVAYAPFIGTVPEPASWAMLIAGFGLVGAMARRRRTVTA